MEQDKQDTVGWLHGLEEYFTFQNQLEIAEYIRNYLSMVYADDSFYPYKRLIIQAYETSQNKTDFQKCLNFITDSFKTLCTQTDQELDLLEWAKITKILYPNTPVIDYLYKFSKLDRNPGLSKISDIFSRGQVKSKIWLINELKNINDQYPVIYHFGGWYGQLTLYLANKITYEKFRMFDMDEEACKISDQIFNINLLKNYKAKSVILSLPDISSNESEKNMPWIMKTGFEYDLYNFNTQQSIKEKTQPNLIINTSAEHMSNIWYTKLMNRVQDHDPLIAIQSNNLFGIEEHVNCVHSLDHMKRKYPMSRIHYEGELQLKGYKRFMLIGQI
jgi:hypothetical protein